MACSWITESIRIKDWRNFQKVINKAITSARNSISVAEDWLVDFNNPIKTVKGKEEIVKDFKLSRYICYLIVQNADPSKEVVALGQTYFAIQTRKQEITEQEYDSLSDDEKRFYQRKLTKQGNYTLQKVATSAGVKNMAELHTFTLSVNEWCDKTNTIGIYSKRGKYGGDTFCNTYKKEVK